MEKIVYLFKRVVESEQLAYIGPAISKVQRLAGRENLNSLNGLLSIAKAFSIKVIFVPDFGAKVKISGWSDIVNGQRYIFLSRNCSECHLIHTLQHELGHHLLDHFCPDKLKNRIAEFEAPVFASLLFLLGDILFNKLVLLARSIYGEVSKVNYRSFTAFLKSLRKLQSSSHPFLELYRNIGNELERLDVLLGFYRDKFVVHVLGPYQEGVGMGVYHPEFRLDHSSRRLTEFDFEKFNQFIFEIRDLIPKTDKYGRPLTKASDPRPKVEVLFRNLHKIEDASLREKAEGYIRSVGLTTPDIYTLVESIKEISLKLIDEFMHEIKRKYLV